MFMIDTKEASIIHVPGTGMVEKKLNEAPPYRPHCSHILQYGMLRHAWIACPNLPPLPFSHTGTHPRLSAAVAAAAAMVVLGEHASIAQHIYSCCCGLTTAHFFQPMSPMQRCFPQSRNSVVYYSPPRGRGIEETAAVWAGSPPRHYVFPEDKNKGCLPNCG